jgi:hypothetical protein
MEKKKHEYLPTMLIIVIITTIYHLFYFLSFVLLQSVFILCLSRGEEVWKVLHWNSLFAVPMLMVFFLSALFRHECLPQLIKQVIDELLVFPGCKINYTESENISMQHE